MVSGALTEDATGYAAAAQAADRPAVDLRDVVQILRDRILFVAAPVLLALLLAVAYLGTATRLYTGVTSILIDARVRPAVGDPTAILTGAPDAVLVESQVRLISSEPVLRRVVEAEHLDEDPEFVSTRIGLRTRLFQALGLVSSKTGSSAIDKETRAVLALAPRVVVKRSERTYIADVEVTSSDPIKAAALANAVARAYLADQQAARNEAAERDSDWVAGQIETMQTGLQSAESKVEAYKREHGILSANGKPVNEQELADAITALGDARAKTNEVKARYEQIRRAVTAGRKAGTLPDALKSPTIDRLRGQFAGISQQQATLRQTLGDRHPALLENEQAMRDVRRLIDEEVDRVEAGLANEYQTAQANVVGLEARVAVLRQATVLSNENRVRLDELQRDVDARRAVYDRFLRARDTVREQTVDAPIGRIIAPAIAPSVPSSPKTFAVLALSLAGGIAVGVGLALVLDLWAGKARAPRRFGFWPKRAPWRSAVPRRTGARAAPDRGVPVLGHVPSPFADAAAIAGSEHWRDRIRAAWPTSVDVDHEPLDAAFLEAVEWIDLGPAGSSSPRTVLLTSITGFESRTTLALALAERAAAAGQRALVIDADGAGGFLRDLVAPGARPALMDLSGTTRLCYRVLLPHPGSVSIVPVLAEEARIARRLASRPETLHLDGIKNHFDLVLIDGPTVDRLARAGGLAASADMILAVLPAQATQADLDHVCGAIGKDTRAMVTAVLADDIGERPRVHEAA